MWFSGSVTVLAILATAIIMTTGARTLLAATVAASQSGSAAAPQTSPSLLMGAVYAWLGITAAVAFRKGCSFWAAIAVDPTVLTALGILITVTISLVCLFVTRRIPTPQNARIVLFGLIALVSVIAALWYFASYQCALPSAAVPSGRLHFKANSQVAAGLLAYSASIEGAWGSITGDIQSSSWASALFARTTTSIAASQDWVAAAVVSVLIGLFSFVTVKGFNTSTLSARWRGWPRLVTIAIAGAGVIVPLAGLVLLIVLPTVVPGIGVAAWRAGIGLGFALTLWLMFGRTSMRRSTPDTAST